MKRDLFDMLNFPMTLLLIAALIGIAVEIAAHLGNAIAVAP